ncbi:TetR/AcrR family transcriptional regulator [Aquimarina algiphila]|uniref:TetR/AcrR family transcriptional regulator n=1 Tax=Aquimarina algiphila TaxID=2047982 RepID=UPI00232F6B2B|nr:TetR/AcrR family transcriptional regulator [Aquimarina algiphila]
MGIKTLFEQISKNEGISVDEIAKKLGVAKSTIYYSINKNALSLKLHKALKHMYPHYLDAMDDESVSLDDYNPIKVADYVVGNEEEMLRVDKFRLWLQTKVQDGVIEVLSIKKSGDS